MTAEIKTGLRLLEEREEKLNTSRPGKGYKVESRQILIQMIV